MKKLKILLIAALAAAICLAGCGKESEEASSEIESITIDAEDIPEPTPVPTPEAETEVDDEEPPGEGYVRSSLTNMWVTEEVANSRPIAVMMPTDKAAQPQYAIGNAGILYEIMEEGDISRQMAIIEDWKGFEKIGNVRSIRRYYIPVGLEWDSIIVHFGGPFYVDDLITRSDVDNITGTHTGNTNVSPGADAFFRDKSGSAPHNAYTSGEKLLAAIEKQKYEVNHRSEYWEPEHFTFTNASNPNTLEDYSDAESAKKIDLSKIFPVTKTALEYNEAEGVYYKTLHQKEQIDKVTGEQLTFTNVIIQQTEWAKLDDKDYKEFKMSDSKKPGFYCTKGKVIPITWSKAGDYAPTKYYDMNGEEIVLNTGKTYIAIAQEERDPIFE